MSILARGLESYNPNNSNPHHKRHKRNYTSSTSNFEYLHDSDAFKHSYGEGSENEVEGSENKNRAVSPKGVIYNPNQQRYNQV